MKFDLSLSIELSIELRTPTNSTLLLDSTLVDWIQLSTVSWHHVSNPNLSMQKQ
jgi:hypothetical protein